jgi:8-oxo-dGTP diphosphatase
MNSMLTFFPLQYKLLESMRKTRPQCGLLIENKEGRVLLQLRDNNPSISYPNRWGTFGGQIEEGETPDIAIAREIGEEMEYELSDPEYFGNFPFDGYDIYMYRIVDHNLVPDNLTVKEGRKGRFFSLEEVKEVDCAFNCREIVIAYFNIFHSTNISPGK